jgi:hypothetical protein
MATYKFQNHNSLLIDPIIESVKSSFSIGDETVSVSAVLNSNGSKLFWVDLGQMPNTDTWTDEDLQAFAESQLETFKV